MGAPDVPPVEPQVPLVMFKVRCMGHSLASSETTKQFSRFAWIEAAPVMSTVGTVTARVTASALDAGID